MGTVATLLPPPQSIEDPPSQQTSPRLSFKHGDFDLVYMYPKDTKDAGNFYRVIFDENSDIGQSCYFEPIEKTDDITDDRSFTMNGQLWQNTSRPTSPANSRQSRPTSPENTVKSNLSITHKTDNDECRPPPNSINLEEVFDPDFNDDGKLLCSRSPVSRTTYPLFNKWPSKIIHLKRDYSINRSSFRIPMSKSSWIHFFGRKENNSFTMFPEVNRGDQSGSFSKFTDFYFEDDSTDSS